MRIAKILFVAAIFSLAACGENVGPTLLDSNYVPPNGSTADGKSDASDNPGSDSSAGEDGAAPLGGSIPHGEACGAAIDDSCVAGASCFAGVCLANGDARVSLTWERTDGESNHDLYVLEPNGEQIYWRDTEGEAGRFLEYDPCPSFDCKGNEDTPIESVVFPPGTMLEGDHQVWVVNAGPIRRNYTLEINVGGESRVIRDSLGPWGAESVRHSFNKDASPCAWSFPMGDANTGAPYSNNHEVGGHNLLNDNGTHLGADYWSGGACTDKGALVYAAARGRIAWVQRNLGSYLDVVIIEHNVENIGKIYTMYGHINALEGLEAGQEVTRRTQLGALGDVTAWFNPCHLHFEVLSEKSFTDGPFCNGCAASNIPVSPGYDGDTSGEGSEWSSHPETGDSRLEPTGDEIDGNYWYAADEFIEARLDAVCPQG